MAEYKTFTCDLCAKHDAKRFAFPSVDHQDDPVDGKRSSMRVSRICWPRRRQCGLCRASRCSGRDNPMLAFVVRMTLAGVWQPGSVSRAALDALIASERRAAKVEALEELIAELESDPPEESISTNSLRIWTAALREGR